MIQSAFQNHFAMVPQVQRPRSQFRRVSRHKHTFDEGELIPFYLDDVLPGDTFNVKATMFGRLATPIHPIMDNMYLEVFWFYVPNRTVWTNFQKQHGERLNPGDSVAYTTPIMTLPGAGTVTVGSLWDHFGLPMQGYDKLASTDVSALPFRMYNKIWNEWFRDQLLDTSLTVDTGDAASSLANYTIKRVRKFKDQFTTARNAPQLGSAVAVPIVGTAPVKGIGKVTTVFDGTAAGVYESDSTNPTYALNANKLIDPSTADGQFRVKMKTGGTYPDIYADLAQATGVDISTWREAVTTQQAYEIDMRGGSRFQEMVFNHFGVINPDSRLQRSEFLGYSRSMVNIHPVPQTSDTGAGTAQGNLAAFGTVSNFGNGFVKTFTEHGYVIGLVAVRSDLSYQESLDRHWSRQTRFDYYYPVFANISEQAILKKEVNVDGTTAANNQLVHGYQEPWYEYRYKTSKVCGKFRSTAAGSLESWHLAEESTTAVSLDSTFVEENAPLDRCIAVSSEPHFIFDCLVENVSARVMPVYSSPGLSRM